MKANKWGMNRKGGSSRLIVDEYDLIKQEGKEEHAACQYCREYIPQRLLTSHQNVCILAEENQYYAGSKVENVLPKQKNVEGEEDNRKNFSTKGKKKMRKISSNISARKNSKNKFGNNLQFSNNPSVFSQKSVRKNKNKFENEGFNGKCHSVRKLSSNVSKKPLPTHESIRIQGSKSKGDEHQKLKKRTVTKKDVYYGKIGQVKGKRLERFEVPNRLKKEKRQIKEVKQTKESKGVRGVKVTKQMKERQENRRQRQRIKQRRRVRQRQQQQQRSRNRERQRQRSRHNQRRQQYVYENPRNTNSRTSQHRRHNIRHHNHYQQYSEHSSESYYEQIPINQPHQTFNFITRTMNQQFEMMRQQFSQMSDIFNSFQGFNINNGFVFYEHEVEQDSSYEVEEEESEAQQGLTPEELHMIPKHKHRSGVSNDQNCTVCLNSFKPGETIRTLPCHHKFHANCIDEWLGRKPVCPVCRKNIRSLIE